MRYHSFPIKKNDNIRKFDKILFWQWCGETGTLIFCFLIGEYNLWKATYQKKFYWQVTENPTPIGLNNKEDLLVPTTADSRG